MPKTTSKFPINCSCCEIPTLILNKAHNANHKRNMSAIKRQKTEHSSTTLEPWPLEETALEVFQNAYTLDSLQGAGQETSNLESFHTLFMSNAIQQNPKIRAKLFDYAKASLQAMVDANSDDKVN